MFVLAPADVGPLCAGLTLLASGGGGVPRGYRLRLERALLHPVEVLDADDLPADTPVTPVGLIGAVAVLDEQLPGGSEIERALEAAGVPAGAPLLTTEIGGLNGATALLAAIETGRPFVDADLMGRSLPRLNQLTTAVGGRSFSPAVIAVGSRTEVVVRTTSAEALESVARGVLAGSVGWGALALPSIPAGEISEAGPVGGLRRALQLGRALASARAARDLGPLVEAGVRVIGSGTVIDVDRGATTGAVVGIRDASSGAVVRLEAQDEFLVAFVDGAAVAAVPELIAVLELRGDAVLSVDQVRPGFEVAVVTMPAAAWWTAAASRLAAVSPAAFGIDLVGA